MRLSPTPLPVTLCALLLLCPAVSSLAQSADAINQPGARHHDSDQWKTIAPHLADPGTATAQALETQADILRARRFPEDAIDFYNHALDKGGDPSRLLDKIGLAQLEMRNVTLARMYFLRAVKLAKKDAQAWNNLGAVEYLDGSTQKAVSDYRKAIKLDKHEAVFHANLATAYFERKDYESARKEMTSAMKLDPEVFERRGSDGGVAARVLSSEDRARFAFEMAKLYARQGMDEPMLHALAQASEAGMDIQRELRKDQSLFKLADDPRVVVLVHNAAALRASRAAGSSAPVLPASAPINE